MTAVVLVGLIGFYSMFGNIDLLTLTACMSMRNNMHTRRGGATRRCPGAAACATLDTEDGTNRRVDQRALQSGNVSLFSAFCEDYGPDYPRFI